jgi:hypothetical protein
MDKGPSIKGRVFGPALEDVQKLVSDGKLKQPELGRWLHPADLVHLGKPVDATDWYDIRLYARVLSLLRDVVGRGSNDYLRQRGAQTAERLLEGGLYSQMEYLKRMALNQLTDPQERHRAYGRDLKLLTSISASILNFAHWEAKPDPDFALRYLIEVSDAADFPEQLGWTSDGFVNRMARQHRAADLFRWERVRADLIVFRMIREL